MTGEPASVAAAVGWLAGVAAGDEASMRADVASSVELQALASRTVNKNDCENGRMADPDRP